VASPNRGAQTTARARSGLPSCGLEWFPEALAEPSHRPETVTIGRPGSRVVGPESHASPE